MPQRLGARHAKDMLAAVRRCNRNAIAATGDLNIPEVAVIIDRYVGGTRVPNGFLLAVAEFVALAVEAGVVDPATWEPLAANPPPQARRTLP